ncbi:MAG TPA: hypothetical protein VND91_04430 [Candidatus Saccharimonadia bacterium]|nr:hypothetical protein [Candidatus Saccharimonadia bacterium]
MSIATLPVTDDELFAFLLDDTLESARVEEIRAALLRNSGLAQRLATISEAYERTFEAPARDDLYEARMWRRVAAELPAASAVRESRRRTPRLALAAAVLVAVGVGFLAGRAGRDDVAAPDAGTGDSAPMLAANSSQRVLAMHLAAHFESTERALLVASNSPDEAETIQALARELTENNRLYADAAARAGRPQLADFLRQLEPVLLELANGGELSSGLVAEQIRDRDLAFKSRAAAALARREYAADPRITL